FGGCAVALVDATKTEAFKQTVTEQYQQKTNLSPTLYDTKANEGVRSTLINLSSE
ncbi:MAG TPA: galactokinase, partial [Coxiellaceae bacterium]|nr:galactokinase [Coxiellaceae bacterium]